MADNTTLNAGSGGDLISTDDVAGVKVQRVKVQYGVDGSATDVSTSNPLPISDASGSITVDGTVAATQSGAWNVTNVSGTVTLPTGAASAANQATEISSLSSIDTSLTNLSKAEDTGHTTGDRGIPSLAVRQDADASLADTTLDYTPLQVDANGFLKVNIKAGAGAGGTASTDDAAFSIASGSGTPFMGVVTADSVDSGDVGVVGMLANRQLKVTLYNSGGSELSVGGGTQYTEDAAAANDPVGNALIVVRDDSRGGSVVSTNGDNIALRGTNSGELYVKQTDVVPVSDNSGSLTVDNGGTFAVQATLAAETTKVIGTINISAAQTVAATVAASATSIAKAEDAASANGDTGVNVLSVRQDTLSSLTSTDGDYAAIKSSSTGAIYVNVAEGGVSSRAEDVAAAGGEDGIPVLAVRRDVASSGVSTDGDWANLSVTSDGSLRVSGSSGTTQYTEDGASAGAESLVLAGAVRRDTAASSSGTDGDYSTINTDASGRLWVNASGAAVPVTDNSGSLTVDNAGTFAVQAAIAAGSTNIAKAEDVASADADVGVPAMAIRKAAPANTSGTDGDYEMLQMSAGRLWVDGSGVTLTVASHAVTNAGTFAVQESGTQVQVDDAAFTPATSKIVMVGFEADETATDSVDEGDGGAARMTLDRKQIVTPYVHAAAGGTTSLSALSTGAVYTAQVKGSAGKVYSVQIFNLNAAARYVRLYNQTGAPASTDGANIVWRGIIPGATTGAGFIVQFPAGLQFATGIGIRASAAIADNDTTVLAANELVFNVDYI